MKLSFIRFAVLVSLAGIFSFALATDESGIAKTVDKIGTQLPSGAIFTVKEKFTEQAGIDATSYGFVYIDMTKESGRAAYATLLAAKANGSTISRMAYHKESSGLYLLDLIITQ